MSYRQIFKYPLVIGNQNIRIHADHKPLCVQMQNDQLCLWAEVDPEQALAWKHVLIVGTGHPFHPQGFDYVGTVQDGPFVWHCYMESGYGSMTKAAIHELPEVK